MGFKYWLRLQPCNDGTLGGKVSFSYSQSICCVLSSFIFNTSIFLFAWF